MKLALDQIAARQLTDYDDVNPGTVFGDELRLSLAQAYEVQTQVARLRRQRGEKIVGYKVGCVIPEMQQEMQIDQPVYGRVWDLEQHLSGVHLSTDRFAGLAIEGELAVRLAADVPANTSADGVADRIGEAVAVIELHNDVFRGREARAAELVANNTMHAGVVAPGQGQAWRDEEDEMSIVIDGRTMGQCGGRSLTRNAVRSISWLSKALAAEGEELVADQWVLTGTLAGLYPIEGDAHVAIETSHFGRVEAHFES